MTILFNFKILYYFIRPYWIRYSIVSVISLLLAIIEFCNLAVLFSLIGLFLGNLAGQSQSRIFVAVVNHITNFFPTADERVVLCAVLVILIMFKFALSIYNNYLISSTGAIVMVDLKQKLLIKYTNAKFQYFLDTRQGHLVYVALTSPDKVALTLFRMPMVLSNFIALSAILVFLFSVNVKITFFLILAGVMYCFIFGLISRIKVYHLGRTMAQSMSSLNSLMNEFITGIKHIHIYNAASYWIEKHKNISTQHSRLYASNNLVSGLPRDIIEITLIPAVMIFATIFAVHNSRNFVMVIPTIGVFIMGIFRVIPYISNMGITYMQMSGNFNDCELVYNELMKKNDRGDKGSIKFKDLNDSIVFDSVFFSYESRNMLLNNLNIIFKKKQISALVGMSGSGKSTIINMILGLYKPKQGRILIDGIDLEQYEMNSWLSAIGFVSQDPFIYHATIAENISFGAKYSMAQIIESAKMANAHDFISAFPQGYDTIVGERGMKLSGGQQQRIAIARAVIRNPKIFIFDEATSALDNESERLIQSSINQISKNTTMIVIAHRLTTIQNADKIFFLCDGVIKEEGCHDDLIKKEGYYFSLQKAISGNNLEEGGICGV